MIRVDAHQHVWRLERGDYGWLTPDLAPLYRDFGISDLQPHLVRHEIDRTVLVQAAPTTAETDFLLATASREERIAGVVGWIDFESAEAIATLERLAENPKFVGVRPMIQDIADDEWVLNPAFDAIFEALARLELTFDALVLPRHLPHLSRVVNRHPELDVIVDHGAKPTIRDHGTAREALSTWRADLAAIAAASTTYCKLSGLVTEARPDWTVSDLAPYVDALLELFGPDRLVWGSDWPVVRLAGDYERWWDATAELLASLGASEREAILGGNAVRFYELGRRS